MRKGYEKVEVRAKREVILCAGAVNTPHLLLLSGIGPAAELQSRRVEPLVDLPGVGKSMRDVAAVGVSACARRSDGRLPDLGRDAPEEHAVDAPDRLAADADVQPHLRSLSGQCVRQRYLGAGLHSQ